MHAQQTQLRRSWTARLLLRLASSGRFAAHGLGRLAQRLFDELLVAPRLAVDPDPQMDRRRGGGGGGGGAYRGPLAAARAVHRWLCLELAAATDGYCSAVSCAELLSVVW